MRKTLSFWQLSGFLFTGIAGTLLHFLYEWTGQSAFVAPFSAINESIWEHMKLLFFPMFFFALVENFFLCNPYPSFWCIKCRGILKGVLLIPILYYTYTGISGTSADWINITIFFLADAVTYLSELKLFYRNSTSCKMSLAALFFLCLLAFSFVLLTYIPPKLPLFVDPRTQ